MMPRGWSTLLLWQPNSYPTPRQIVGSLQQAQRNYPLNSDATWRSAEGGADDYGDGRAVRRFRCNAVTKIE